MGCCTQVRASHPPDELHGNPALPERVGATGTEGPSSSGGTTEAAVPTTGTSEPQPQRPLSPTASDYRQMAAEAEEEAWAKAETGVGEKEEGCEEGEG